MIKRYHTEKEKKDIKHNDVMHRLAKLAAKLPLLEAPLGIVDSITICNGVTPTLAKKWIIEYRNEVKWVGTHWTSWLPKKGDKKNDMDHMAVGQRPLARDRCTMGAVQEKMPPVRVHTWNHSAQSAHPVPGVGTGI